MLTGEALESYNRIKADVELLVHGWSDRIEYTIPVTYHDRAVCDKNDGCECPVKNEKRNRFVNNPGLLDQLRDYARNKDTSREPKAERNPPRVKKAKLMPELNGFLALDEITCDIYSSVDRIYEEAGRDRRVTVDPIHIVLAGLTTQVSYFGEERPDLARKLAQKTSQWVAQARRALNLTVSDAAFGDTVCGNCGGGLVVAWDNSSDVRCVGSPSEPPCGHTYPMSEWVSLYEQGRAR